MLTIREPEQPAEITTHRSTLEHYCSPEALAFEITTQEQAQVAADLLNDIKDRVKVLKAAQELMTKDFVAGLEKINALFQPSFEAASKASQLWKKKIAESNERRKQEATRALQEVQAAVASGDAVAAQAAIIRVQPVEKVAGLTARKVWKQQVINPGLVPADFWVIDESKVTAERKRQLLLNPSETPVVPGVKFWQEETFAATG